MSKQTIFDIVDDFDALFQLAYEANEEGDEEAIANAESELESFRNELTENLEIKADNYAFVIADASSKAQGIKEEISRLNALKKYHEKKADSLKSMLLYAFEITKTPKLETNLHKFSVSNAGGRQGVDIMCPPSRLPEEYRYEKVEVKADTDRIREDLLNEKEVPGCALKPRARVLRIK